MRSNWLSSASACCVSAHSALERWLAMISLGASDSVLSPRIIRCRLRKPSNSGGAFSGMCWTSAASSLRAVAIALSKRAISASISVGAMS